MTEALNLIVELTLDADAIEIDRVGLMDNVFRVLERARMDTALSEGVFGDEAGVSGVFVDLAPFKVATMNTIDTDPLDALGLARMIDSTWGKYLDTDVDYPGSDAVEDMIGLVEDARRVLSAARDPGYQECQALVLVRQIAAFIKSGEMLSGKPWDMPSEDAMDTIHTVIDQAREVVGLKPPYEPPKRLVLDRAKSTHAVMVYVSVPSDGDSDKVLAELLIDIGGAAEDFRDRERSVEIDRFVLMPLANLDEAEAAIKKFALRSGDEVEIDDNAFVSEGEDGVWVSAWVWLRKDEVKP